MCSIPSAMAASFELAWREATLVRPRRVREADQTRCGARHFVGSPNVPHVPKARKVWAFLLTVKRDTQKERTTKSRKSWGAKASMGFLVNSETNLYKVTRL